LRQCLTVLRRTLGETHKLVMNESDQSCVWMRLDRVAMVGSPADGAFLEGLDLPDLQEFEDWLREQRQIVEAGGVMLSQGAPQTPPKRTEILRPSIAVLPFFAADGEPHSSVLGEMMAEEVSRLLSRSRYLDVISHFSCRTVNTRQVSMSDLRKAFDVDFVVSGVVRVLDGRYMLDVDFTETNSGRMSWSTRHKGEAAAFLSGDCETVWEIGGSIMQSVIGQSLEQAATLPLPETESHMLFMSAVSLLHRQDLASSAKSRAYFEELSRRAPQNSTVRSWLGMWYVLCIAQSWHDDLDLDVRRATENASKALELHPSCALSLAVQGFIESQVRRDFEGAAARFDQAISLDPNHAMSWLFKGVMEAFRGDGAAAVRSTKRSRFLSPKDPGGYLFDTLSATAELANDNYAEALHLADRSYRANPNHNSTLRVRTIALHSLGRLEEARASAFELERREPNLTIDGYLANHPAGAYETGQKWARALSDSGIRRN
ncbi:MAG: tetratricopeptide repeat protein, partial [Pseudomonadota bacterium]